MADPVLIFPDEEDDEALGPAMAACSVMERRFVRALMALGVKGKATAAAKAAGYGGPKATHNSMKQCAFQLMHRQRVQEAIHEESIKRLSAGKPMAVAALLAMASDPNHPDHFRAVSSLLDRAGLAAKTEHKVTVERTESSGEQVERLVRLAQALNLDPKALLGRYGVTLPEEPAQIEGPDAGGS